MLCVGDLAGDEGCDDEDDEAASEGLEAAATPDGDHLVETTIEIQADQGTSLDLGDDGAEDAEVEYEYEYEYVEEDEEEA